MKYHTLTPFGTLFITDCLSNTVLKTTRSPLQSSKSEALQGQFSALLYKQFSGQNIFKKKSKNI